MNMKYKLAALERFFLRLSIGLCFLMPSTFAIACNGCSNHYCQCESQLSNEGSLCLGNSNLTCTTDCGALVPNNENCGTWCNINGCGSG